MEGESKWKEIDRLNEAFETALARDGFHGEETQIIHRILVGLDQVRRLKGGIRSVIYKSLAERTKYPKLYGGLYWDISHLIEESDLEIIKNRNRFALMASGLKRWKPTITIQKQMDELERRLGSVIDHQEFYQMSTTRMIVISPYKGHIDDTMEKILASHGFEKIDPLYSSSCHTFCRYIKR